jgi:hypothetical protein
MSREPTRLSQFDSPLDRLRSHREADPRPVILTEGRPDLLVIGKLRQNSVFPLGSKSTVLRVTEEAIAEGLGPLVALVDLDFDDAVIKAMSNGLPVVTYANADVESMLWETDVLKECLDLTADSQKVDDLGGVDGVRQSVDDLIRPIQRLRVLNVRRSLGLNFDGAPLRRRIKISDMSLNLSAYCDAIRSEHSKGTKAELLHNAIDDELPACAFTGNELMRGKDRIEALGIALRRKIGRLSQEESSVENLARLFYATARSDLIGKASWLDALDSALES